MPYRVLVLDDDANFRALVKSWLEPRGHQVIEAETGKAATRVVDAAAPDLVIVDGLLPDTDGFRWIKARRDVGDETPMIFTSFFYKDMNSFRKLVHELRVRLVLQKTLSREAFVAQIESVLERLPASADAAVRPATAPVLGRGTKRSIETAPASVAPVAPAPKRDPAPRAATATSSNSSSTLDIADAIAEMLSTPPRR